MAFLRKSKIVGLFVVPKFSVEQCVLQGVTVSSPHQVTKAAVSVLNQIPSDYQHVKEESIHDIMSSKKDEKHSDFTSQGDDTDRVKDDNMSYMIRVLVILLVLVLHFVPSYIILDPFFIPEQKNENLLTNKIKGKKMGKSLSFLSWNMVCRP